MKNELYFPVRMRRDGSLYADKNCFWKIFLRDVLIVFLLIGFFVGTTLLVLIDPFEMGAPTSSGSRRTIELSR